MKKWTSWRSEYANEKYDVIIIGSGMSGLTAGVLLAMNGKKVLILEKHFKAGGWTHTFKRKNYEWDVGIHYIGEVHSKKSPVRKLFDIVSNGALEWSKMNNNYDRIIFPDKQYNLNAPREQFIPDMIKYFPGTEDKFIKYLQCIDDSVKSGHKYYANKALPKIISNLTYKKMTQKYLNFSDRTTKEVIMDIFNDKTILGVLTGQWGDYGLPPEKSSFAMHAAVVRHYLNGGNYPIGTSRRIAETAAEFLESMGGKIFVNAPIKEVIIHKGKAIGVRTEKLDEVYAKKIISSAGVINTYGYLLKNYKDYSKQINSVTPTPSYVCLYMGLNKSSEKLNFNNTNLWIYPDYDHDNNLTTYLNNINNKFPVVYISFPSSKDPDYIKNNPNNSTMEAITVSPWNKYNKWRDKPWKNRGSDYEEFKSSISERILKVVYEHVPQAKAALDYHELSTPLTVNSLANYQQGELYGVNHDPSRFRQKWLRPQSDIRNLYLTGQDIITVGVTSALFSGLLTASTILKKNLMKSLINN